LVHAKIIEVGPTKKYKTPSEASRFVEDGDYVEIEGGIYKNDTTVWRKIDLFIFVRLTTGESRSGFHLYFGFHRNPNYLPKLPEQKLPELPLSN
jgi:hypothetical protein